MMTIAVYIIKLTRVSQKTAPMETAGQYGKATKIYEIILNAAVASTMGNTVLLYNQRCGIWINRSHGLPSLDTTIVNKNIQCDAALKRRKCHICGKIAPKYGRGRIIDHLNSKRKIKRRRKQGRTKGHA